MSPMHTTLLRSALPDAAEPARKAPGVADRLWKAPDSRLTAEEYAAWLLPPEPRGAVEKVVHLLSLGAGVLALTTGVGALWWIL